jgi:hypothetical protein
MLFGVINEAFVAGGLPMRIDDSPVKPDEALGVLRPYVSGILRTYMKSRKVTYAELSRRLARMGIEMTENTLTQSIRRGKFPAYVWVACLRAMEVEEIDFGGLDVVRQVRQSRPKLLG